VGGAAFVTAGTITLVFLVLHWLPGDPAALIAGDSATAETIANIRTQLGTDRSLWDQYLAHLGGLAHGDLGTSFATREPVLGRLWAQVPATMMLTLLASGVALVAGLLLGVVSAVNRGKVLDRAVQTVMLFLTSMPSFWLGILLILVFSVTLRWLPAIGNGSWQQLVADHPRPWRRRPDGRSGRRDVRRPYRRGRAGGDTVRHAGPSLHAGPTAIGHQRRRPARRKAAGDKRDHPKSCGPAGRLPFPSALSAGFGAMPAGRTEYASAARRVCCLLAST
jgi:ABC-type proline/glycine betaine transport system permease subunit